MLFGKRSLDQSQGAVACHLRQYEVRNLLRVPLRIPSQLIARKFDQCFEMADLTVSSNNNGNLLFESRGFEQGGLVI
jgi:hypothetical protein